MRESKCGTFRKLDVLVRVQLLTTLGTDYSIVAFKVVYFIYHGLIAISVFRNDKISRMVFA